jgi:hypothetical protein
MNIKKKKQIVLFIQAFHIILRKARGVKPREYDKKDARVIRKISVVVKMRNERENMLIMKY